MKPLLEPLPDGTPPVSVVMPVLNEEKHLRESVYGVLGQSYDGDVEIILALGPSTDSTNEIAKELTAESNRIILVDNPKGATPVGLNLAVEAAHHEIVVRVDAHTKLPDNYISEMVKLLQETGAANVGGLMDAQGETPFEKAVAAAYNSRLGLGGGSFHLKDTPEGPAETVFLGVYRKTALEAMGGFNESLIRAQDWELNYRLRKAGYLVWLSPEFRVTYRPRSTVKALARQFFKTGQWRREIIFENPDTARLRYLVPPTAVAAIAVSIVLGILGALIGNKTLKRVGSIIPLSYLSAITIGSATLKKKLEPNVRLRLPLVLAVMHICWGTGFLKGVDPKELA